MAAELRSIAFLEKSSLQEGKSMEKHQVSSHT